MNCTYTGYNSNGSTSAGNAGIPDTGAGVVAEDGYLKRGLKPRVLHGIGWPAQLAHSKFVCTTSSGAFYAP